MDWSRTSDIPHSGIPLGEIPWFLHDSFMPLQRERETEAKFIKGEVVP
jgi:hypothetical protein